ncbi:MAG: type II toxin-antitoxin system VapC family toxin [Rhodobacteraceae bacterium]|nr:type II toxin-antitoxin system VapC family toxin [Paracoccaceae bacterium]MCY4141265.1 type II toxin-antitoxin system VapC family toxin [Paracoccaceae bacterium]
MRLLLDSHVLYWWMIGSARLPRPTRALVEDKGNTIFVSAVSFYEIEYKIHLRRLDLPPQELRAAFAVSGMQSLSITVEHAELAATLNWDHCDPWDRLLAAQARLEGCAFLSADGIFDDLDLDLIWEK